jgi:hypothetical protein
MEEPVYYCKNCLSLNIQIDDNKNDVCGNCGAENFTSCVPYEDYEDLVNETNRNIRT